MAKVTRPGKFRFPPVGMEVKCTNYECESQFEIENDEPTLEIGQCVLPLGCGIARCWSILCPECNHRVWFHSGGSFRPNNLTFLGTLVERHSPSRIKHTAGKPIWV